MTKTKKKNEKNNVTPIASNKNLPKTSRRDAVCILVFFYSITRGPFTVLTDGPADPRDNSRVPLSEFLFFNNSDNPYPFIPIQIRRRIHNEQKPLPSGTRAHIFHPNQIFIVFAIGTTGGRYRETDWTSKTIPHCPLRSSLNFQAIEYATAININSGTL